MPSSYTSSLRLTLPVQGELAGSWGNTVNTGITQLVDASVAGTASITMTAANYTLSNNNGATDESRSMFLVLGGTPGNSFNVIVPAVSKLYFVTNGTGFAQTVKTASGSGISVPNGARMALRCDGTDVVEALNSFGSLTINTGKVLLSNGQSYAIKSSGGANNDVIGLTAGNVLVLGGGGATDSIQFWNQGLQRMTFDSSGNLGIGTSSPSSKLDVSGAFGTGTTAATISNTTVFSASNIARIDFKLNNSFGGLERTAAIWSVNPNATGNNGGALVFGVSSNGTATTPSEVARFDSSGNLGLGVTPGTWAAAAKVLDFAYPAFGMGANGGAFMSFNARENSSGSYVYKSTDEASLLELNPNGSFRFFTAPSGTAGNAISFTQAMTLDASGNLGVGRIPDGTSILDVQSDARGIVKVRGGTASNQGAAFYGSSGSDTTRFAFGQVSRILGGTPNDDCVAYSVGYLAFAPGAGEKARITSGGDLLVGQTGTGPVNSNSIAIGPANTGGTDYNHLNGTASGIMYERFNYNAVTIGSVTQSGTTAVLYNTTSDQRLKTNIVDAPDASALIDGIKVRSFDWISDNSHQRYGMVAQELFEVAPEAVHAPADPDEMMAVDYSKLVPMLIKELQSLRARVAALEQA